MNLTQPRTSTYLGFTAYFFFCFFHFPTFIPVDRFHLHCLPQHLGNLVMVTVLGMHPGGFPFLVLNADISTCGYEEWGDGRSTESSCHMERSVAREVTAVLVAVSLKKQQKMGGGSEGQTRKSINRTVQTSKEEYMYDSWHYLIFYAGYRESTWSKWQQNLMLSQPL